MDEPQSLITFTKELERFKQVFRLTKVSEERYEDDAQHSWHLAMTCLLFRNYLPDECDMEKIYELALVHDLPEIKTGDKNPFRDDNASKPQDERDAMESLTSILPSREQQYLLELHDNYDKQQNLESQIVKGMDKLLPLISTLTSASFHSAYQDSSVTEKEAETYIRPFVENHPFLNSLFEELMREARRQEVFYPPSEKQSL